MLSNPLSRKWLLFFVKLLAGIGILYWLLQRMDWGVFVSHIGRVAWPFLLLLIAFSVSDRLIMAYKWNLLLRANGLILPTYRVLALYLVSNLLGSFTPGNLGGDAYRVMALSPWGKNAAVLSTVLLERAVGLLALLIFVIVALPFSASLFEIDATQIALVAISGVAITLLLMFMPIYRPFHEHLDKFLTNRPSRVSEKLHRLLCAYTDQHRHGLALAAFCGLTLAKTGFLLIGNFLVISMIGLDVSLAFIFMVMPVMYFILRLPISINGIGLQEGLFAYVLVLAGYTLEDGVIVSFLWRLTNILAVYLPASLLLWCFPMTYHPSSNSMGAFRI